MRTPEPCLCGATDCRQCFPYTYHDECECEDSYGEVVREGYCPGCHEIHMECVDCEGDELIASAEECVDDEWRCPAHLAQFVRDDEQRILLSSWLERRQLPGNGH